MRAAVIVLVRDSIAVIKYKDQKYLGRKEVLSGHPSTMQSII